MPEPTKKDRILKAALELITENGFHGTPVSRIADKADVGTGTIYRYFDNKETLINELYILIQTELKNAIFSDLPQNLSIKEEFYHKWKNILTYFVDNPEKTRFLDQYATSPFMDSRNIEMSRELFRDYDELIKRAKKVGLIKNIDRYTITVIMWGTVKEFFRLYTAGRKKLDEKLADEIFESLWTGIAV